MTHDYKRDGTTTTLFAALNVIERTVMMLGTPPARGVHPARKTSLAPVVVP
jgi:hypothetical protein